MNLNDYISLLNNPNAINHEQILSLEKIMEEFPYFQSTRVLHLKGLYDLDSFKYNHALKITAAHTTDRTVLFDFITSDHFISVQEKPVLTIEETPGIENTEIIISTKKEKLELPVNTLEESIKNTIKEASFFIEKEISVKNKESETDTIKEKLSLGKPLNFSKDEKYSFQEWLQLANFHSIKREDTSTKEDFYDELDTERQKKLDLIDKFIQTNPKIIASKTSTINITVPEKNIQDSAYLMTETLAKVYLEQKKYQKAIQAYEILILKYPEKSTFFADRIDDIKTLQQNNN